VRAWTDAYRDHGRIVSRPRADELRETLVDDWWEAAPDSTGDAVMIAYRRVDVAELNALARARMHRDGRLGEDELVVEHHAYAVGDRVVARRNDRRAGVVNGTRGQVVDIDLDQRTVSIKTRDGKAHTLDSAYLDDVARPRLALTAHAAQGATVDRAFVLGSDELYREWGYRRDRRPTGLAGGTRTVDRSSSPHRRQRTTSPGARAGTAHHGRDGKTKVAVDYAENVAAGLQILVSKWNELYDAGIIANTGDPQYLENWYFALWDYNTGFHANTGSGPWGLGWTNNPQNADYAPGRSALLRSTYADAAHPADWPYQERVIGFMETPLVDYKGHQSYAAPSRMLALPSHSAFCTVADDECNPSYVNATTPSLSYCTRADRECWWHTSVTWATCSSVCATSPFTSSTTATEPAADTTYARPTASTSVASMTKGSSACRSNSRRRSG
jgi:hypothetical protein